MCHADCRDKEAEVQALRRQGGAGYPVRSGMRDTPTGSGYVAERSWPSRRDHGPGNGGSTPVRGIATLGVKRGGGVPYCACRPNGTHTSTECCTDPNPDPPRGRRHSTLRACACPRRYPRRSPPGLAIGPPATCVSRNQGDPMSAPLCLPSGSQAGGRTVSHAPDLRTLSDCPSR